ncbi:hypothetical protein BH18ACT4_BH18ACT4_05470 [soil metagenome]
MKHDTRPTDDSQNRADGRREVHGTSKGRTRQAFARASKNTLGVGLAAMLVGAFGLSATSAAAATRVGAEARAGASVEAAVAGGRVDLETPSVSDPTSITNPRFPISDLTQVIQLGEEDGVELRHEITLLDATKVIEWNGQRVETVVSQFVAYGDGLILEVALDYFAQADDGSVWYFGEDVSNYEDGVVVDHDGTWLAGRDGPPGMIMPADPQVGDVYRPENIPGLVFEEVTVTAVDQTVNGPTGPVPGAIFVQEELQDGTLEDKVFAPGYGEFRARVETEGELVTVAVAVPTDAVGGAVPRELTVLSSGATDIFRTTRWDRISSTIETMNSAWATYQRGDVPELLQAEMTESLDALVAAVHRRDVSATQQAAVDVALAALDLELQYRAVGDIDRARLGVWQRQLTLDRVTHDAAGVASDKAIIDAIRDRLSG